MKRSITALVIAGTFATGTAHSAELALVNFGGAVSNAQKTAYVEPFEKATGTKVFVVEYNGEMAKIKAMVESKKVSWDVVSIQAADIGRACEEGLLEKLDPKVVGKKDDFIPDAFQECGVASYVWSAVYAYNADKLKVAPKTWADFWDLKKFPGKRSMKKEALYNLEFALMADGVAPKDVYKVLATKSGPDRAFKKLDEIKGSIQWWEAGAQPPQFLVSGDVVMATAYNGRINAAQREGKNLQVVWTGNISNMDFWAIPKGSPNKALAEKFVAYASKPETQKNFSTVMAYGPVNINAAKLLDSKTQANLPTFAANMKDAVQIDQKFWLDHGEDLQQRFNAWSAQ